MKSRLAIAVLLIVGVSFLLEGCDPPAAHLNKAQFEQRQKAKEGKEGR